ncbi:electron transfer flavoprotein subunit beta/FixA family protein [Rhodovulum sulfidophilum]|uniref:electron transfer flavoprotein subunit beta/FixA family protein n=1 Tax=Rhodovulum sulfidophilum TaxID=35806 RepID=UPI0019241433|nr:electron transfer flavoprotein subunit beta/FixA family protein [Rhodovulum sulfidophilum]MBL3575199.1 electron transfer flavoprotein subunit beta/FixA family protein [Rhodovulum sulfidophilum]MBL3585589.1 electron transfer flavoprotein subunit beta/FixA family protein [Rhodovulum sulfidophilum]MCE8432451.1 electron transfer flavoprotein subunit beta/FixA family protein [Rhodovulum sulfidophilum]MCF4116289.1 electron transfer flavoprotein subunit beta/FixA family protein [Rhodovulum sulfidop
MSEKLTEPDFPAAEAIDAPEAPVETKKGLNIVVCIKQVPDSAQIRVHPVTNTIMRQGVPTIINPYDLFALEEAMRLRDDYGGTVTVLTMGPPMAEDALRRALGLGADKAVLITDRRFAGSDTLATSFALSAALAKLAEDGPIDIVFTGKQTIDGDTAQVGPGIARRMGLNQLTYVSAIDSLESDSATITVRRRSEGGVQVLQSRLPCLITMLEDTNLLRRGSLQDMLRAARAPLTIWSAEDAGIEDPMKCGLRGSPTVVRRVFAPQPRAEKAEMVAVEGKAPAQIGDAILDVLFAKSPKLEADLSAKTPA